MFPWQVPASRDDDIRAVLQDFDRYREKFLRIRPRTGGERVPFKLNAAQAFLNQRLNDELRAFGRVRALIPKARRMGVSTLISGRYYHKTVSKKGRRAHVVAHRTDSASNLFREVKLFHEGVPDVWRAHISASNARELIFDALQSVYKVSSAEGGDIGRSDDTHLLHLSEAGYFDNTEDLSSGLLQTVLNQDGTEIAMESTGNGASGMFFNMCEEAHREKNTGLWRLHFLPWRLMPENDADRVPQGWTVPREFADYAKLHGLTLTQTRWFWEQNHDLAVMNGGQPDMIHRLTRQEFPATFTECFSTDSTLDFFAPSFVQQAMLSQVGPTAGSLKVLACDPNGDGSDECFVADREGAAIGKKVWGAIKTNDQNVQADWLVQTYRRFGMDVICIDSTGVGKGLVDACRLRMRGLEDRVVSVNFSHGANDAVNFANRRAELHFKFQMWLQGAVSMPNDKFLQEDCAAYKWGSGGCRRDEMARLFMTLKEKIRAEIKRSPDRLDTVIVSFAVNDYALAGLPNGR